MRDALTEARRLHQLGVGVDHVVVPGHSGEEHDVGLGHRTCRRLVLWADLDVVEESASGWRHVGRTLTDARRAVHAGPAYLTGFTPGATIAANSGRQPLGRGGFDEFSSRIPDQLARRRRR